MSNAYRYPVVVASLALAAVAAGAHAQSVSGTGGHDGQRGFIRFKNTENSIHNFWTYTIPLSYSYLHKGKN